MQVNDKDRALAAGFAGEGDGLEAPRSASSAIGRFLTDIENAAIAKSAARNARSIDAEIAARVRISFRIGRPPRVGETATYHLRMPTEIKDAIAASAKAQGVSMTAVVIDVCSRGFRQEAGHAE